MKIWEIVGLAGAAWFGWDLWQKYQAGNNLQVNLQNIDLSNFPNGVVTLSVQNVTNTPLTIQSMAGNVSVQGTPLAAVSQTTPITLQPNQVTNVPINFSASLANLPNAIVQVINELGGNLTFTVVGAANVQGIPAPVPINVTQNFQT